jgi:adenine-specific DNA-methyltransferase
LNTDFVALELLPEHSVGIAPYQNLLIEGDNFDVLRYLNIAYRGRIKCIYIDPPYNTGNNDFIYNDKFIDKEHRYRHSTWLEFMYRRLVLARDLLAEDGVIFVSISEHEHARLELLMDEVFSGMKVANFIWRTRSGANMFFVMRTQDLVLREIQKLFSIIQIPMVMSAVFGRVKI